MIILTLSNVVGQFVNCPPVWLLLFFKYLHVGKYNTLITNIHLYKVWQKSNETGNNLHKFATLCDFYLYKSINKHVVYVKL